MNKYKISIGINIVLLLALMVCIFFLTKKDPIKETVIELLDGMLEETKEDFSEHFKHYESAYSSIKKEIDMFYYLINQENASCSPRLMSFYEEMASRDSVETERIFKTLYSIKETQSQDFILLSKLMEYRFIKKQIENLGYLSFFWFDEIEIGILHKKDTIRLGESNIVEFGWLGRIFNAEQPPILMFEGDTISTNLGYYIIKEESQKRGLVKREGYITCFHPRDGIVEFPFKYSYYVK